MKTQRKNKLRAVIYARSAGKTAHQRNSMKRQEEHCINYIEEHLKAEF